METKNINYSFIAVPTNLFFALDNNLRNALTVLLQLSSVFADADGYFFRTNEDLQADFKMGKNLTIAVLESLYQYGLLQVKSVGFTKKNGKRQVNFYRVNVDAFKKYEQYHIYTITKNEELHLETVDYKAKDFKVTYTATTVEDTNDEKKEPTEPSNNASEEIPSNDIENVSEGQETPNLEFLEIDEDCPLTQDELKEHLEYTKTPIEKRMMEWKEPEDELAFLDDKEDEETELKQAESSIEVIETASVVPTDLFRAEKREVPKLNIDEKTIQVCKDLVERYKKFNCKNSSESVEMCVAASKYITKQYNEGKIYLEDKDRLIRELVNERFRKFSI